MKLKSIHIIYSGLGGHFDYVYNLINAMKVNSETGILFFGVEMVPEYYIEKCKEANIKFETVLKSGSGIVSVLGVLSALKKYKPLLIYIHSNATVLPARMHKIRLGGKLILVEHHNNLLKNTRDFKRSRQAQKHFDKIIFLTETHLKETSSILSSDFRPEKSVVIKTGIPETFFSVSKPNSASLFLGMQSRLVPIKDHLTLLKAFEIVVKEHPNAILKIAGEGTERTKLEELVSARGLSSKVNFEGMLSKSELSDWMSHLTIYIHATLGETSSIAIMEALAKGLPIIASDVSGVNDFLNRDVAILVPPKNVESMSKAILDLIRNEKERLRLSENAFTFARANCSLHAMAIAYADLENSIFKMK